MRLVRAPMRISYVGGGTDYLDYFKHSPGGVLSAAIDQYVYVYSNPLSDIADENYRFTYRESESVVDYAQFKHPVVRETLRYLNSSTNLNMGTFADLPSGLGLGGSSAFSVAMVKILENSNEHFSAEYLAEVAIHIERNLLLEPGGYQDQYAAAFGGLRTYDFNGINNVSVSDSLLFEPEISYLEERQLMVWLGETRNSSAHSLATIESIQSKRELLEETYRLYQRTQALLKDASGDPAEIFRVLAEAVQAGWKLKQEFTSVTDGNVIPVIKAALESDVSSFKLCGAGGSGFVLLMAEPWQLDGLRKKLNGFKFLKPRIDFDGCKFLL
jgi:D-glycero-alpha-D-manno-heptose-7-phosphate kinase